MRGNRGASTATIIIAIFISAGIMFVLPLMIMASKQDKAATLAAQTAVTEAVNEWATKGVITQNDIDNLQLKLNAIGQAYDMEIEVRILDENAVKKATDNIKNSGVYITKYTAQIKDELPIYLNEKDTITIIATAVGESVSDQLSYKSANKSTVQASAMVSKSAN